jgi:two-component system sensor histidine kinase ChiS
MKKIVMMIILGVLFATLLISYSDPLIRRRSPVAENGVIDLTSWNFEKDGMVRLFGEWEYYDGQLLTPEHFNNNSKIVPQLTGYNTSVSNRINLKKRILHKEKRNGTFRLVVKINENNQYYGIKIQNKKVYASNKLFVNGERLGFSGDIGLADAKNQSNGTAYQVFFPGDSDQMVIILQISNFYQPFSLDEYNLVLGLQQKIQAKEIVGNSVELCGAALCFFIALYYVYLYLSGSKEKEIWFSIMEFISLCVLFLFSGETFIYRIFPWYSFELFIKIKNLAIVCILYSIVGFANLTNKMVISDRMYKIIRNGFFIYSSILLFTPYRINIYFIQFISIPILMIYLSIIFKIGHLLYKFKPTGTLKSHSILYMICLSCVFINYYNYMLFHWSIVTSKAIGTIAIILFIILSQLFLAIRFMSNYKKMLEMEKIKDEFFIKSSYMLNAPLHSILNLSGSIINKMDSHENVKEEVLNHAQMTKNIASGLLGIVNATLDVTLLQNNELKLSKTLVDMGICMELAIKSMEELGKSNKIHIINDVSESLLVLADEERVRQIVHNLISNSINSMSQGTITIIGERIGSLVSITVKDNGCGISDELQEEIFNPYIAYHSEGIGLGLYISRQLAEHMGGTLRLEWSKLGKGSIFVLELPSLDGEYNGQVDKSIKGKNKIQYIVPLLNYDSVEEGLAKTILIVDDEMFNIQTAAGILASDGYNIISAYSGDEALEMIEKVQVDLVILDVMMPATSGITTCKKIREKYSIIELPILLSSRVSVNNDLNLGLLAQANDFISKPFMEKELSARVKTLIALKTSIEDAAKSEQAFLQAQIKPHFIYNAINTIISFCYTDSGKAAKLLTDFSKYLRLTFDIDNSNVSVSIQKEIELIEAFVEIQNARFGDRFIMEYDIAPSLLEKEIPPLILQPLVENSIKHGFYQMEGKGYIYVTGRIVNESLVVVVRDTGIGMSKEKVEFLNNMYYKTEGVGLWNIKRRIGRIKDATMEIQSIRGEGTTVTISIKI